MEVLNLIKEEDILYLRTIVHNLYNKDIKLGEVHKEGLIDEICILKSDLTPTSNKTHKVLM